MVFSSMIFVFLFFALNIAAHNLCSGIKAKNRVMLVFSLVFYSWAGLGFTAVMLLDVFIAWGFAILIEKSDGKRRGELCAAAVALILGVLGFFKYTGFLFENVSGLFGLETPKFISSIMMPIGISFYSFQLISYVADVYRGDVKAQRRGDILLLYACLFHQCVAGPIIRYSDIEREIMNRRSTPLDVSTGISRFTVGLAKKAVLANSCAEIADLYFKGDAAKLAEMPAAGLWLSGLAFMLQIYFDFSAYSDMAIGMGLMCGFHYRENFNYPYIADSVTDFWRRWHISLSSFFRDYVYIPLGGNRRGRGRQLLNLLVVWSLTGFWHGASWNFVVWGLYFFLFLAFEKFVLGERLYKIPKLIRQALVLVIVYFCWIIFKFEDTASMLTVLRGLFCGNGNEGWAYSVELELRSNFVLLGVCLLAATPLFTKLKEKLRGAAIEGEKSAALTVYSVFEIAHPAILLLVSAAVLTGNSYNPFLYFNF